MRNFPHLNKHQLVETALYAHCVNPHVHTNAEVVNFVKSISPDARIRMLPQGATDKGADSGPLVAGESQNPRRAVVIKPNLFLYELLEGYDNWEIFISEGLKYLLQYLKEFKTTKINRFGVRSVNKFVQPDTGVVQDAFFTEATGKRSGLKSVPFEVVETDTQYYPDYDLSATIVQSVRTLSLHKPMPQNGLLDINVFFLSKEGIDSSAFGQILERIHELKNRLFFSLVSEEKIKSMM